MKEILLLTCVNIVSFLERTQIFAVRGKILTEKSSEHKCMFWKQIFFSLFGREGGRGVAEGGGVFGTHERGDNQILECFPVWC